jgi:hypothetical protein
MEITHRVRMEEDRDVIQEELELEPLFNSEELKNRRRWSRTTPCP